MSLNSVEHISYLRFRAPGPISEDVALAMQDAPSSKQPVQATACTRCGVA
jgi:hypothetical protein